MSTKNSDAEMTKMFSVTMKFPSGRGYRTKEPMTAEGVVDQVQKETRDGSMVSQIIIDLVPGGPWNPAPGNGVKACPGVR